LKYTAVSAAVAGSALAGYEFDRWQNSVVPASVSTRTVTEIQTPNETITETVKLASLHGRLFFDYNGNGRQDAEEPAVADARLQLKDDSGKTIAEAVTDSAGDYKLEDIRTGGAYRLHVEADKKFRYMCRSIEDLRAVTDDYEVILSPMLTESGEADIGLMEGFLTLPFLSGAKSKLIGYFDHDPAPGKVKNYLGDTTLLSWPDRTGTEDGHQGIDWILPLGTDLVASAPGRIDRIDQNEYAAMYIDVIHSNSTVTSYGHISKALRTVGEWVERGDVVALSGDSGVPGKPHIHFALFREGTPVDPFRDIFGDSPGYWTKDNDPHFASA
jgi:murein DD-endopeptidase MepM/ murein hydrolase activator NlpD